MTVKLFLKLTCKLREPDKWYAYQMIRPRVVCKDGWSASIQHSELHYCSPRKSFILDGYETVELGYPSKSEPELEEYAENPRNQETTVFNSVPIELVERIIERHGGIIDVEDLTGEYFKDIRNSYVLNYVEIERGI